MGLLDDAIREHLDLKRARGGDPAEIERMEREALGPVRREPTIGSNHFEAVDERPRAAYDHDYGDDVTELEQLQDLGYHDSTAPHPHPHYAEHDRHHDPADPHSEQDYHGSAAEPEERPRRRFLRRNRDSAPPEPSFEDTGFPEDESALEPHELLPHVERLEHDDFLENEDRIEAAADHDVAGDEDLQSRPPHLRFDHPPKRPRFTAEPPTTEDAEDEAEAEQHIEPEETTEFDVQQHIAETRHLSDEEPATGVQRAAPQEQPPADEDEDEHDDANDADDADGEDVLEETPEFLQDTPEHDRLWFEQRPPKDFDFDG